MTIILHEERFWEQSVRKGKKKKGYAINVSFAINEIRVEYIFHFRSKAQACTV